jgi:hypothetical protein
MSPDQQQPLSVWEVLGEEYWRGADPPRDPEDGPARADYNAAELAFRKILMARLHTGKRTALCFSGGGIRSATFGLGVLQGLAAHSWSGKDPAAPLRLLAGVDYLSTVSGGGYLGGWFSAWASRHANGAAGVIRELAAAPDAGWEPEPAPLRYLRKFSNYLNPQLGAFSADTWTLVATTPLAIFPVRRPPSAFDTSQRLVASVLYELPFGRSKAFGSNWGVVPNGVLGGWEIESIITIQSGQWGNIIGGNAALLYTGGQRPNATGQPLNLPADQRSLNRWFNTAAIAIQPQGTIGNLGRNVLLCPAEQNWDFAAHKTFQITEKNRLTFRFEAFNFPNHPFFGMPGVNIGSTPTAIPASFGQISSTTPMRQIQLGLKYSF